MSLWIFLIRKLVYQDCVPLWCNIDFSDVKDGAKASLTDAMLSSLLIRVNARNVTRSLNLKQCGNLHGTGLGPLSGSQILEDLDLRQYYQGRLVESLVVPILRTMIPFKLFRVRIRDTFPLEYAPSPFTKFLYDLRTARQHQVQVKKISCAACDEVLVEELRQIVANVSGVPSTYCGSCRNHYCRRGSCATSLVDCGYCGEVSCDSCSQVKHCVKCSVSFCEPCNPVHSCGSCSKGFCRDCDDCLDCVRMCAECDKILCIQCNQQQNDLISYCEACSEPYCGDCRQVNFCALCQNDICEQCEKFNFLDCCSSMVCEECVVPQQRDECEKSIVQAKLLKSATSVRSCCARSAPK